MASMLQTEFWAKFKESSGWRSNKYGQLYGLSRFLPLRKSILYFPEIPQDGRFSDVFKDIKGDSTPGRIFSRFEFLELWSPALAGRLVRLGLVKAFEDVQPEYRQWLLLDKSEQELLKGMKPKGRYNIYLAKKHHLKIDWGITDQSVKILFELYDQTAKRANFRGRALAYFQLLAKTLADNQAGDIIIVSKDGQPLAALLLSFYGGVCSYLYGGSGDDRNLMAPYLTHWEAIREAKKRGLTVYDLLAIAPFPSSAKSHPHDGLTRFKTQFGGQSIRLLGSWDLVQSHFWYSLYKFVERRRRPAVQ